MLLTVTWRDAVSIAQVHCAAQPGHVAVLARHINHELAFSFAVHRAHKTSQHGTQFSSVAELLFQGVH